jgi:hypothetical protein
MHSESMDWRAIHGRPLISVPDCWKGCGQGFCCSNSHPDLQFQFLPASGAGTVVLYLEEEYAWIKAQGRRACGDGDGREPAQFHFDFGGPGPLRLRHAPCTRRGDCADLVKPLLCRTYPFLPVLGLDGRLEEVLPASIIDETLRLKTGVSPCPLQEDPGPALLRQALEREPELAAALAHPRLILYTRALRAFLESYRERLAAWAPFAQLEGPAFWKAWELAYLGGRLADREAVARAAREAYAALAARHGEFLP